MNVGELGYVNAKINYPLCFMTDYSNPSLCCTSGLLCFTISLVLEGKGYFYFLYMTCFLSWFAQLISYTGILHYASKTICSLYCFWGCAQAPTEDANDSRNGNTFEYVERSGKLCPCRMPFRHQDLLQQCPLTRSENELKVDEIRMQMQSGWNLLFRELE
jgi:hypothetical protein